MAKAVTHLQIYKPLGQSGGFRNTTICARVSNAGDDLNVTRNQSDVTCKICKKAIANEHHYNHKWIGWMPAN